MFNPQPIDIIGATNQEVDPIVDASLTYNMYLAIAQTIAGGKALISIPGAKLRCTVNDQSSTASVRGLFPFSGNAFGVVGNGFYQFLKAEGTNNLTAVKLGELLTDSTPVVSVYNTTQLLMIDGSNGYLWDGSIFQIVPNENFPSDANNAAVLDARAVVTQTTSNILQASSSDDLSSYDPTENSPFLAASGGLMGISMLNARLYVFGKVVTGCYYDAGTNGFPYAEDTNTFMNIGCGATNSIANSDGYLVFLSSTQVGSVGVMLIGGEGLRRISTPAMEREFQSYETIDDAIGYIYKFNGHYFYDIHFPTQNKSWCYDLTTNLWFGKGANDGGRYFAQTHMYFGGVHYVGSYSSPTLYDLSQSYTTNNGEVIKKTRISANICLMNGRRAEVNYFEAYFRQGSVSEDFNSENFYTNPEGEVYVNKQNEPYVTPAYTADNNYVADPVVYLSISLDGAKTFGNEVTARMGSTGNYNWRAFWNNLGVSETGYITFKIDSYENVGLIFCGAAASIAPLRN